jgi:hypothetical protein
MSPALNMRKIPKTLELNLHLLRASKDSSSLFRWGGLLHKSLSVHGLGRKFEHFPRFHSAIQFPDVNSRVREVVTQPERLSQQIEDQHAISRESAQLIEVFRLRCLRAPEIRVVSMGRCNTGLQFIRGSLKSNVFRGR